MDETKLLISKIEDLSRICTKRGYPEFSKFLDMSQQVAVKNIKSPDCSYYAFGGYADAERKVIGCFPEEYEYNPGMFPICTLLIEPSDPEGLTHRDFLGSLIGLGIKRECIGDIILQEGKAYAVCLEDIRDFVMYNLKRIGNRSVKVTEADSAAIPEKTFKRITGTVASSRLDCVLSLVVGTSRSKVEELVRSGRVMVNYLQEGSVSAKLKPNDTVSVRGFGKFIYLGDKGETRKGRLKIEIDLYS